MTDQESIDACVKLPELPKTVDTRSDICEDIALVLKIGRDFQNKDGYRGAHYDTVKLLCDAIEYQQEQLKTKTEVGDRAKLREAPRNCDRFRNADKALEALERHCNSSGNGCIRCPVAGYSTEEVECKIAWLFAPAAGKEGGVI